MQLRYALYALFINTSINAMGPVITAAGEVVKAVLEEELSSGQLTPTARIPTPPPLPPVTINEEHVSELVVRHYFRSHQEIVTTMAPAVAEQLRSHIDSPVAETSLQANNFIRIISEHNSEEACETEYARSLVLDTMRLRLEAQQTQMQTMQTDLDRIRNEHVSKRKAAIITASSSLFSALAILAVGFITKK